MAVEYTENKVEGTTLSCFTPAPTLKDFVFCALFEAMACMSSSRRHMMPIFFWERLYFSKIFYSTCSSTELKAFFRLTNDI